MLIGTRFLSLVALPLTAQTDKERNRGSSRSELEHQQLRDLLAGQSAELEAMRERMHQLQQRMELLEAQLRAQNNPPATKESGCAPVVSETRDPDPIGATVALPARRETFGVNCGYG